MANAKEIQNRINSIHDTMKITNAMYMMSSMKLRKAKLQLENTEPYFFALQEQIRDILLHFPDIRHLYFDNRDRDRAEKHKKRGFVVITGDKGMAGAYNHNALKEAQRLVDEAEEYKLLVVGELGRHFFKAGGYTIQEDFCFSANNPSVHRARMITEYVDDLYKKGEMDEVYIIYTRMISSMKEQVEVVELLPLKSGEFLKHELEEAGKKEQNSYEREAFDEGDSWLWIYPSPKRVLEKLAHNYVTGFLYGALVESFASEENARMLAMQAASDNAKSMLRELSIQYNRVRQAAITQEITEVIGGAKALRNKKKKQAR